MRYVERSTVVKVWYNRKQTVRWGDGTGNDRQTRLSEGATEQLEENVKWFCRN